MAPLQIAVETNGGGSLRLAEHEASMARLSALMRRVNAPLEPAEFIEAVAVAFQEARAGGLREAMDRRFRAQASFQMFQNALRLAFELRGAAQSVLALGCGRGFAGEPADFAVRVVHKIFVSEDRQEVAACNLSPDILRQDPETLFSCPQFPRKEAAWDLVVAHSLLHYIPDLAPVFSLIRRLLKPSGGLILSHEPNSRFWQSAECQSAVAALRRARRAHRWRRYLNAAHFLGRFRASTDPLVGLCDRVNRRLEQRYGLSGPLAENEIQRLVDVHRPEAVPSDFRIGLNGFDVEKLAQTYMPGFRLVWVGTSGHLGYNPPSSLPLRWRHKEMTLAAEQPLDGSVFTAYWTQGPAV